MGTFIVRRLLGMIPMMFAITVAVFLVMHAAPGNAFDSIMNPHITNIKELQMDLAKANGLDKPLWWQYFHWIGQFLTGNWGMSFTYHSPVISLIGSAAKNSIVMAFMAEVLILATGIPFGIYQARNPYTKFDYISSTLLFILFSVPFFVLAIFLIYFMAIDLQWFPAQGSSGTGAGAGSFIDLLYHAALPAITIALVNMTLYTRFTRGSMLDVSRKDYVRTARAKGLSERVVFSKHVLRNALIPIVTQLGFDIGGLIGGQIILEGMFQYQGMGLLVINSVSGRDYPVIMATTVLIAVGILLGNLVADILYAVVDPRIRYN